jgi:hypothetical protein
LDPATQKPPLVSKSYNASKPTDKYNLSDEYPQDSPESDFPNPSNYDACVQTLKLKKKLGSDSDSLKRAMPFRTSNGSLVWGRTLKPISEMKKVWDAFFKSRPKLEAKKASGFRVRYDSRKLSRPLMIQILPAATFRFGVRGDQKDTKYAREIFERIIAAINEDDPEMPQLKLAPKGFVLTDDYYKVRSS